MILKITKIFLTIIVFLATSRLSVADERVVPVVSMPECDISKILQTMNAQDKDNSKTSLIDYKNLKFTGQKNMVLQGAGQKIIDSHIPVFSIFLNEIENNKIMSIISLKLQ